MAGGRAYERPLALRSLCSPRPVCWRYSAPREAIGAEPDDAVCRRGEATPGKQRQRRVDVPRRTARALRACTCVCAPRTRIPAEVVRRQFGDSRGD